jgi:hypothetical protein
MLEENKHFRFVDFKDSDITGIELLLPEFLGVVYHYHQVRVLEEEGQAKLQFGYTIVHSGEHDIDDLNSDEKLHIIMGDLLTYILMAKIEDEARNINSQKLNIL